jgi:branched-subunit amino acid ABC-type transport system permease component
MGPCGYAAIALSLVLIWRGTGVLNYSQGAIVTIGLLIGIEGLAGLFFGGNNRSFPLAFSINGLSIGTVALGITRNDIFTAIAVLAAAGLFLVVFRYTSIGLRLRATAFNTPVARLLGFRVGRMLTSPTTSQPNAPASGIPSP